MRSYKKTTSTLKKKTSSVLNDCTNAVVEESLPKKAKLDKEKEAKAEVGKEEAKAEVGKEGDISKTGHFTSSSSMTLNFS